NRASDPAVAPEAVHEAVARALGTLSPTDREGAERFLFRLAEELVDAPTRPDLAGSIALHCGALVERGLAPTIALHATLNRLERQLAPGASAFVDACREAAEDGPPATGSGSDAGDQEPTPDPVEHHGERIAALMPVESGSFQALEPFSLAAIAMLSRS